MLHLVPHSPSSLFLVPSVSPSLSAVPSLFVVPSLWCLTVYLCGALLCVSLCETLALWCPLSTSSWCPLFVMPRSLLSSQHVQSRFIHTAT